MLTMRAVNKEFTKLGDIELVKVPGYFIYCGDDADSSKPGTYVFRLNELTLDQWIAEATERLVKPADPLDDPNYVGSRFHY